jgi:ribonuclease HI
MTPALPELRIHIDGASRGNPGKASWGVHVARPDGTTVTGLFGCLGHTTNNVAEYHALINALRYALDHGTRRVAVFSDSLLVVEQIAGRFKVKHPNMVPLFREAQGLMRQFESASLRHVRREQNKEADALANQALDGAEPPA